MGRYAVYLFLSLMLATVSGCTEKPELTCVDRIDITASIAESDVVITRTGMSGSTASFISGDNIGVFETLTGRQNVSFTYNGTAWSTASPLYWRDMTSPHTFAAYYPYNAAYSGTKATIPVLSAQAITTQVSPVMDFLAVAPFSQTRSAAVGLPFKHAFTLIQLNVKMGILNVYSLTRVTVNGGNTAGASDRYGIVNITGAPAQVGYDVAAGSLWAAANNATSYAQSFNSDITGVNLTTSAVTLYFFVLPGTYANPVPSVRFRLSLLGVISNTTLAKFTENNSLTFQPGMKYVYNVTIGGLLPLLKPKVEFVAQETVGDTTILF